VSSPLSSLNQLLHFSLDHEWVLEIGEEHAVNQSLEIALQDDLPDLSTVSHYKFDLELEFDIKWYLDILADEASGTVQFTSISSLPASNPMVDKTGNASTVAPEASAWDI
jgi:hypothetical protein